MFFYWMFNLKWICFRDTFWKIAIIFIIHSSFILNESQHNSHLWDYTFILLFLRYNFIVRHSQNYESNSTIFFPCLLKILKFILFRLNNQNFHGTVNWYFIFFRIRIKVLLNVSPKMYDLGRSFFNRTLYE